MATKEHANPETGASTARRNKYARARVAAGMTYAALRRLGFGSSTVMAADRGMLPKLKRTRDAYLEAIKLENDA